MVAMREIESFCDSLAKTYGPRRVVLFGSYATGSPREDSDVDLLITMDYIGNRLSVAANMIRSLNPRFAVDLIIRTEAEVQARLKQKDAFITMAIERGRVLYEIPD